MNNPKEPLWFEIWSTLRYADYGETPRTNKELIALAVEKITDQGFDENGELIPPLKLEVDGKTLHPDTGLPRFRLDGTLLKDKDIHYLLTGISEALGVDLKGVHLDGFTTFNSLHAPLVEAIDMGLEGMDALEVAVNSLIPDHLCDSRELERSEKRYTSQPKCSECEGTATELLKDSTRHEGYASALLRAYLTDEPEPIKVAFKKNVNNDPKSLPTEDVKRMITWFGKTHEEQIRELKADYWAARNP